MSRKSSIKKKTLSKRKKKRIRQKRILRALIIICFLLFIAIIGICLKYGIKYIKKHKPEPKVEDKWEDKIYTASLIMVGDALIHSSVYRDANRLAGYNGYDFKPQIEYIKEITKDYDLAYYNQETILGGKELGLGDYPRFNSPYEVGDAMIDAGFNLVSLATNHTVDSGEQAVLNSRKYWNSKENVVAIGSYSSEEEKEELESEVHEINGISYGFLNYSYGTNGIAIPNNHKYLINVWPYTNEYESYKDIVKSDVEKLRDKVDVLIVAMHWGTEYTHTPTDKEVDQAKFLASLGVDIVIGTHPHVVQPVAWIDKTLVFYSLGNFISAQYQNEGSCYNYKCMVGLMPSLTITKTVKKDNTEIEISNIKNELIYTYYTNWSHFKVIPFSNSNIKKYLWNYQNIYNTYKDVIQKIDANMEMVPAYSGG